MMLNWWKFTGGLSAMAAIAMAGTTALAAPGLIANADIETITRFSPHELDHPNGYPDAWHHSQNSAWSGVIGGPQSVSPTHSLYLPDDNTSGDGDEEMRSFATPIHGNPGKLDLTWQWKWDKQAGDLFSATVRISKSPVGGFDLGGAITDYIFLTDGSALSDGGTGDWETFATSISLAPDDRSFDVIFVTGDEMGDRLELGTMWVDDVIANVPEPATMALLGLGVLGWTMGSRRRHG
jgi:hypothetical protein